VRLRTDRLRFGQKRLEVDGIVDHGERARGVARPVVFGPVAVDLDAVAIRVAEIDRLGHAVVGRAVDRDACGDDLRQCAGQRGPVGIEKATWNRPVVPGAGGCPPRLCQVFRPI
jgi:hypothetical protein